MSGEHEAAGSTVGPGGLLVLRERLRAADKRMDAHEAEDRRERARIEKSHDSDQRRLESRLVEIEVTLAGVGSKSSEALSASLRTERAVAALMAAGQDTAPISVGTGSNPTVKDEEIRARTAFWRGLTIAVGALATVLGALAAWLAVR